MPSLADVFRVFNQMQEAGEVDRQRLRALLARHRIEAEIPRDV